MSLTWSGYAIMSELTCTPWWKRLYFERRTKLTHLCMIQEPDLGVNDISIFVLLLVKKISPIVFNEYLCHMRYKLRF